MSFLLITDDVTFTLTFFCSWAHLLKRTWWHWPLSTPYAGMVPWPSTHCVIISEWAATEWTNIIRCRFVYYYRGQWDSFAPTDSGYGKLKVLQLSDIITKNFSDVWMKTSRDHCNRWRRSLSLSHTHTHTDLRAWVCWMSVLRGWVRAHCQSVSIFSADISSAEHRPRKPDQTRLD